MCRWEIFKWRERGLTLIGHVSDRFSDPFSRFSNHLSDRYEVLSGAISFCRRAALTIRWRRDATYRQCTGKRLSRASWSRFNKEWDVGFGRQYACWSGDDRRCAGNQMQILPLFGTTLISGGFQKRGFGGCSPAPKNRNENEGTWECCPVPKTGTRVHANVPWYQKTEQRFLPAPLQKLAGDFFLIFGRESWREFCGEFCGDILWPTLKKIRENFGAFFGRKFVPRKKYFVQTSFCTTAALTKVHSPKPAFYETALLSPLDFKPAP